MECSTLRSSVQVSNCLLTEESSLTFSSGMTSYILTYTILVYPRGEYRCSLADAHGCVVDYHPWLGDYQRSPSACFLVGQFSLCLPDLYMLGLHFYYLSCS